MMAEMTVEEKRARILILNDILRILERALDYHRWKLKG